MTGFGYNVLGFGAGVQDYIAFGVNFDGSNDSLTRGGALTGVSDSKLVTCSFNFKRGSTGADQVYNIGTVGDEAAFVISFRSGGDDKMQITGENSSGTPILDIRSSTAFSSTSVWQHVAFSIDMAGTIELFVAGVTDSPTINTQTDAAIEFSRAGNFFGSSDSGGSLLDADIADFYLDIGTATSLASNIDKFIDNNGKPVDLGADGSVPTGSQPIVFFSRRDNAAATTFATNKGTGGGMTIIGTLTNSSTSPSD